MISSSEPPSAVALRFSIAKHRCCTLYERLSRIAVCAEQARPVKETLDTKSADVVAQRERYYATLRKVALQAGDKIPGEHQRVQHFAHAHFPVFCLPNDCAFIFPPAETSEDISPYATFQLSDAAPQNTLLHSFMYHEQAMTEAASPPPLVGTQTSLRSDADTIASVRSSQDALLSFFSGSEGPRPAQQTQQPQVARVWPRVGRVGLGRGPAQLEPHGELQPAGHGARGGRAGGPRGPRGAGGGTRGPWTKAQPVQ